MKKIVILIGILLLGCGGGIQNDTPLPNSIQDMTLRKIIEGEEANQVITRLHKKEVTTATNYVGEYAGSDYSSTLYLTVYPDSTQALADLQKMAERIQDPQVGGQMGFQHVRHLTSYGENVYMTLQNQRAHFFYVIQNKLYWLETNPQVALAAIKQLLS